MEQIYVRALRPLGPNLSDLYNPPGWARSGQVRLLEQCLLVVAANTATD